jgi:hypothetical protein
MEVGPVSAVDRKIPRLRRIDLSVRDAVFKMVLVIRIRTAPRPACVTVVDCNVFLGRVWPATP